MWRPSSTTVSSLSDVSNQSGASSAEKLLQAWYRLSWQPGLTTVTPSLQDFLRRQSINFNEFKTQLPYLLLELGHGITSTGSHHSYSQKPALTSDRIEYKLCVLMHLARIGRSPAYLAGMMTATADPHGRERLRSINSFPKRTPTTETQVWWAKFIIYTRPKSWMMELSSIQSPGTHEHWYFQKQLKTHRFKLAYEWRICRCWSMITSCVSGVVK